MYFFQTSDEEIFNILLQLVCVKFAFNSDALRAFNFTFVSHVSPGLPNTNYYKAQRHTVYIRAPPLRGRGFYKENTSICTPLLQPCSTVRLIINKINSITTQKYLQYFILAVILTAQLNYVSSKVY